MIKIAYHPVYAHPLPAGHRFPMLKYELIPGQLMHEGVISPSDIFCPQPLRDEDILLTHDADYLYRLKNLLLTDREMRAIGFPLSAALADRELRIAGGTVGCALHALQHGVALNVAGGTHHAFADHGEGFCLLNDFAIAGNYLLNRKLLKKILVVDLDVHQGNGTAALFRGNDRVFTFSMHGQHNYPFRKEQSDLDVGLADGTTGSEYLQLLAHHLTMLIYQQKPDMIFYLSGVDVLETDKFGKLKLTIADCLERDNFVFHQCRKYGIPVTVAMGGGYSPDIRDIVTAHCNTFKAALSLVQA